MAWGGEGHAGHAAGPVEGVQFPVHLHQPLGGQVPLILVPGQAPHGLIGAKTGQPFPPRRLPRLLQALGQPVERPMALIFPCWMNRFKVRWDLLCQLGVVPVQPVQVSIRSTARSLRLLSRSSCRLAGSSRPWPMSSGRMPAPQANDRSQQPRSFIVARSPFPRFPNPAVRSPYSLRCPKLPPISRNTSVP